MDSSFLVSRWIGFSRWNIPPLLDSILLLLASRGKFDREELNIEREG